MRYFGPLNHQIGDNIFVELPKREQLYFQTAAYVQYNIENAYLIMTLSKCSEASSYPQIKQADVIHVVCTGVNITTVVMHSLIPTPHQHFIFVKKPFL